MDQLDPNLNGENVETPAATPAEITTPELVNPGQPNGGAAVKPSPEEVSWNDLSGASQERFRAVTRSNNELRLKLAELEQRQPVNYPVPPHNPNFVAPEVADAVQRLSDVGMATKKEVEETVNQRLGGLVFQMELNRLEEKLDGNDGRPAFNRDEYQDFVARHPEYRNYTPDDVYQKMYSQELLDWQVEHYNKRPASKPTPSLRPTRTQQSLGDEPLTPELIEQRLKAPGGLEWYDKNKDKINASLEATAQPTW